jgi:hypothetical protein
MSSNRVLEAAVSSGPDLQAEVSPVPLKSTVLQEVEEVAYG